MRGYLRLQCTQRSEVRAKRAPSGGQAYVHVPLLFLFSAHRKLRGVFDV